jgi:hypothetical protein
VTLYTNPVAACGLYTNLIRERCGQLVSDGFGNRWYKCHWREDCGLHVVRPGKVQCSTRDAEVK